MPIYEYQCDRCLQVQEHLLLNGDKAPELCECGGNLKKIISNSSFQLKGNGWYVTDYKNKTSNKHKSIKTKGEIS